MSTAAEEFGQLVGTLREWTETHLATDEPQCQLCPVCQVISALRESRPDLVEHLTVAAIATASVWLISGNSAPFVLTILVEIAFSLPLRQRIMKALHGADPVSYTHLTLPTIYSV